MVVDSAWANAQKILCIRLDSLGDVLMTTPAIRAFKESIPGSQITLLTSPVGKHTASHISEIDDALVYEAPWMKASPAPPDSQYDREMIQRVQAARFDAAVIFTVYSQNPLPAALFCYLAEIPLRLAHCRENPYHLLTHWVKEIEPHQAIRHEVQRQLDLAAAVGCRTQDERLSFHVPEVVCRSVERKLTAAGINLGKPWITVHPGVSAPSRQYAPESYAAAVRQLTLEDGLQVVFTGSSSEKALVYQIQNWAGVPSYNLTGQLSLLELGALLHLCPLLLANNTGPVHLAAALGTPVVDLYALTNPQHTPWGVPHRVLSHDVPCKFCYKSICPEGHHNCLRLISPQEVVDAVRDLLAETTPAPSRQTSL